MRAMTCFLRAVTLAPMIVGLWTPSSPAGEISVAAAADLNFAFREIVAEFEKKTGNMVKLSLGSSGNFFAQISNGAPFDLYFSADISYPKKLEEAGLAELDRKSTRLNSSHVRISYAVFCLKKKKPDSVYERVVDV